MFLSPPTYHPNEQWLKQQVRNMMMWLEDESFGARFLLHDRDTKFSKGVDQFLGGAGIQSVRTPLLAPDANAYSETCIGKFKHECLNHFMCFSLGHLNHIAQQYVRFFNRCRPHQGLANRTLPEAATGPPDQLDTGVSTDTEGIRCERFLGGLLRHYYRDAA